MQTLSFLKRVYDQTQTLSFLKRVFNQKRTLYSHYLHIIFTLSQPDRNIIFFLKSFRPDTNIICFEKSFQPDTNIIFTLSLHYLNQTQTLYSYYLYIILTSQDHYLFEKSFQLDTNIIFTVSFHYLNQTQTSSFLKRVFNQTQALYSHYLNIFITRCEHYLFWKEFSTWHKLYVHIIFTLS